jgi:hypothetical protein
MHLYLLNRDISLFIPSYEKRNEIFEPNKTIIISL